jgi:hypothetical protein
MSRRRSWNLLAAFHIDTDLSALRVVAVFGGVRTEVSLGVPVVVGSGLAEVQVWGGIHSVVPSWRFRVTKTALTAVRVTPGRSAAS